MVDCSNQHSFECKDSDDRMLAHICYTLYNEMLAKDEWLCMYGTVLTSDKSTLRGWNSET